MKFIEAIGGRKFVLTVLYMVVFALNYAMKWSIPWEALAALGASIGIFNVANAIKGYEDRY